MNQRLVRDDEPVEVQDLRRITDHSRGIYRGIYLEWIKQDRKMSTCNRVDLESLGSWPTLYAQKLPGHGSWQTRKRSLWNPFHCFPNLKVDYVSKTVWLLSNARIFLWAHETPKHDDACLWSHMFHESYTPNYFESGTVCGKTSRHFLYIGLTTHG